MRNKVPFWDFSQFAVTIWFSLVCFYGLTTFAALLSPSSLYAYILNIWFGLIRFYGISNIVGCLIPTPLYIYILNIKVWVRCYILTFDFGLLAIVNFVNRILHLYLRVNKGQPIWITWILLDIAIPANTHSQAETLLHSFERAAGGIGPHVNAHKTEYRCYSQTGDISTLDGTSLKLVDKFTYLGCSVLSTEKDIDTQLTKAWTPIDRLSIIWKSDLTDKMKHSFFQAAVVSILLYGCITWTLTKRLEKIDGNYTRMLRAILNTSWRQHSTRHQLYGHLPPITKAIKARRTRHAGHCWRSRDELISDVLLWSPTYARAKVGRPARTYIQQLSEDTGCIPEDLPEVMNDREKWRERIRDIRASGTTWWWCWDF